MDFDIFSLVIKDYDMIELVGNTSHKVLVEWGMQVVSRYFYLYENNYSDERVLNTFEILKKWLKGEIDMFEARKFCFPCLEVARSIDDKAISLLVRACSHMLAICHAPAHAEKVSLYVLAVVKVISRDNYVGAMEKERDFQINLLKEMGVVDD